MPGVWVSAPVLSVDVYGPHSVCRQVVCVLVGACAQSGQLAPIDLIVEEHFHRAAPGGMGGTKAAGNYSPVLVTQLEAKRNNYAGLCQESSLLMRCKG